LHSKPPPLRAPPQLKPAAQKVKLKWHLDNAMTPEKKTSQTIEIIQIQIQEVELISSSLPPFWI